MADVEAPKESTPLVAKDNDTTSGIQRVPLEDNMQGESMKEKVVAGVGFGTAGVSLATIVLSTNPIAYGSSIIGLGVGPYAAIQQSKISEVEALRQTNKRLGEEVDILKHENERLQGQIGSLEESVKNLQEMEQALQTVQAAEGQSIDELESQLKDLQEIYDGMEDNLNGNILQNLIHVVLAVDNDGDMILDDDEIQELIFKFEELNGVDLDDDKFRQVIIDHGRSLNAIMELVRNLLEDPDGGHEDIFMLKSAEQQ
mmetsp:Transcript_9717/g.16240  ORF Transcript_9717/g.16240 Transcript_9717/m.16240 type:complete len:257 (-) Transcript_9717:40-810(-)|eukprot:CAMPEP_0116556928 /NCGR_PEP_ID=MMETSP0397-20121206/8964_1 /TAXON_ID=216820 /ORGANISM="Cyclophora tenuis, Strain ECT3854" /LENGTH=256 /DNA_ID=CAMNT_0004082343 /DNA_START=134 /DNA_END=904 /DNA_ORIENTATION=-